MDHLKLLHEIEQKWERHRNVLRDMGWEEEKIKTFLDNAKTHVLAVNSMNKIGEQ